MALENFTTWIESDIGSNNLTVAATSITWNDLNRAEDEDKVYKDFGAGHFSGDFTHSFKFTTPAAVDCQDGAWAYTWFMSNAISSPAQIDAANGDSLGFYFINAAVDTPRFALVINDDGTETTDNSSNINFSTAYYVVISRDDDGGVNGTGRLTATITTGDYSPGGTPFDVLTVDCGVGEQNDYQYLMASIPRGGVTNANTDGIVENFNLAPATFTDMAATGGGTGGGSATMEVVGFLDMEATGGGTGGGSATMTLVQWCRFLVDRDGASQAAVAGKVSDVTALVGGQVTAQTQITYTANGTVANPTSITTANGRITAITANPYGSMYASNVTHAVVITTVDTYVEIASDMTGGLESGMTFQNNHEIKATVTGKYLVNWSLSVSSDSANREIEGSVMVNGSEVAAVSSHAETSLGAAGRPMTIGGTGIIALAANDVVSLGVENHTDAVDLVMQHATCTLLKVGS